MTGPSDDAGRTVLHAEQLGRRFGGRQVVSRVSLDLEACEAVALLGPSGCGKTTLLQMLGLLDRPDRGRVTVGGLDAWSCSDPQRAALRLARFGFVFQQSNLLDHLNARDNVALPAWRLTGSRSTSLHRADALLERLGLSGHGNAVARELSAGEAQRVAIARALVNEPRVVLADEPTGNLDSESTASTMTALEAACKGGAALLVVTHDPAVAARAGRTLRMRDGRLEQEALE